MIHDDFLRRAYSFTYNIMSIIKHSLITHKLTVLSNLYKQYITLQILYHIQHAILDVIRWLFFGRKIPVVIAQLYYERKPIDGIS